MIRALLRYRALWAGTALLTGAAVLLAYQPEAAEPMSVASLAQETHFHGLAIDRAEPERLYLATHHGVFVVDVEGMARRVSGDRSDYMGFTPHPSDPQRLYASGHPERGGNMGVLVSEDGGRTWRQIARGLGGPVDFHQMDVSPADPEVLYGAHAGQLQVSRDGGKSWQMAAPAPEGLIDLAASALDPDMLYAATQGGLLRSQDGGKSWDDAYWLRQPATLVHVTPEGVVYAFLVGTGLVRTSEPSLTWEIIASDLGDKYPVHLTVAGERLYAVTVDPRTNAQTILASRDGGKTWSSLADVTN